MEFISDESVEYLLAHCPFLSILDVSFCLLVTNRSLRAVKKSARRLHTLLLVGCDLISDEGLLALTSSSSSFSSSSSSSSSSVSPAFSSCSSLASPPASHLDTCSLRNLDISMCRRVTLSAIRVLCATLPHLIVEHLDMGSPYMGCLTSRLDRDKNEMSDSMDDLDLAETGNELENNDKLSDDEIDEETLHIWFNQQ
eukprot:TRINITY_DN8068_c0_g1_i1.p1 TRINITY_DN8068_c0_g1~~TRINITY_DN8068_c0_g1_i1.p1  ORF type:complete len:197 (-),score=48.58 TRINITY_DN8068_c0_g1_i1:123-713(-)